MPEQLPFDESLERFLPRLDLFHGVEPPVVRELARKMKVHWYGAGEILPAQDEVHDWCWIVLEGLVERRVITSDERIAAIDLCVQGDVFGSLFNKCRVCPPVETVTLARSAVARIGHAEAAVIAGRSPRLVENVLELLRRRHEEARKLRAIATEPSRQRMLWTLVWLYSKIGRELPLTRATLGEIAGLARETAIRMLAPIEKKGFIVTRRGRVEVHEPKALIELLRQALAR